MTPGSDVQFGKFRLLTKLATGGMGEIFLARHIDQTDARPPVALKRILPHYAKDPRFIRMFLREAKIISEIRHPNVVGTLDFGKEQGTFYMTMEFVDGVNLDLLLDKATQASDQWSIPVAIEIVSQALAGISSAHTRKDAEGRSLNIVHLDLSPHNLVASFNGNVKILDFGISKAIYQDDQKAYNALRGTYAYMSPEQCREEEVDPRSDLFTLGVLLYELATLQPLFRKQQSEFLILKAITEGSVPSPGDAIKNFPDDLAEVIARALEKDRDRRFDSADEFKKALQDVVARHHYESGPELLARTLNTLFPNHVSVLDELPQDPQSPTGEIKAAKKPSTFVEDLFDDLEDDEPEKPTHKKRHKPSANKRRRMDAEERPQRSRNQLKSALLPDVLPPAEQIEVMLNARQQTRKMLSVFITLMLVIVAVFGFQYIEKTGWMQETVGSTYYMPETGKLYIKTIPEGATVFVELKKQETPTPLLISDLPFDESRTVEIVMEGYESVQRRIKLTHQSTLDAIFVELKKK